MFAKLSFKKCYLVNGIQQLTSFFFHSILSSFSFLEIFLSSANLAFISFVTAASLLTATLKKFNFHFSLNFFARYNQKHIHCIQNIHFYQLITCVWVSAWCFYKQMLLARSKQELLQQKWRQMKQDRCCELSSTTTLG